MRKRVVFVRQGTWGLQDQAGEDQYREMIEEIVKRATVKNPDTQKEVFAANVETVEDEAAARERLRRGGVDVLVFNSRSQIGAARELKRAFPSVPIIVMTGLIPKEEVIIACKSWFTEDGVRHIILDLTY